MNLSTDLKAAVVSDVSLGFGSPQVQSLARSLGAHYAAPVTIYEPDQSGRPPQRLEDDRLQVRRITTEVSPHSTPGRIEYVMKVAEELNRERPEILVLFCTFSLPVLGKLAYRPRVVVYSLIEMVSPYGLLDVEMNRHFAPRIDVLVFPEENRAQLDAQRCGFNGRPMAVLYNVNDAASARPTSPARRFRRLFYGGAISTDLGLADYFLHPEMRSVPLDLYGDVTGPDRAELLARLNGAEGEPRYQGCVDGETLARSRRDYAFAVVMYRPTTDHTHYAAPNKFFEAIADGVPPIVAPHPQCKLIVERYKCGLVMRDWSFEAYRDAVQQALGLFGTRRYARMVENCCRAVRAELNWPAQFKKLERLLPAA
jgi:glycosyltransferase involved in cell wall biosynthesis